MLELPDLISLVEVVANANDKDKVAKHAKAGAQTSHNVSVFNDLNLVPTLDLNGDAQVGFFRGALMLIVNELRNLVAQVARVFSDALLLNDLI